MQIRNWIAGKQVDGRRLAFYFCFVLLCLLTHSVTLAAEQPSAQAPSTPFGLTGLNTPAHDITIGGTIQQLIATRKPGSSAGVQLLVNGSQGSFTANLGTSLSSKVKQSLAQGAPVQISGTMQTINGKEYLLARTLTISGNQIIVRNENGFLVHGQQRSRASVNNSALYRSAK